MIHHTLRNTYQSSSTTAKTPAKINFLHVSKETPIQTSCLTIIFQADKKGSSTNPKNRHHRIILPTILLYRFKNPSATKRIPITVDIPPRSTRIFKKLLIALTQKFGLTSSHFGMNFHKIPQRLQPMRCHLDITVQKNHIFRIHLLQGTVIPFGKAIIFLQFNKAHSRKLFPHHVTRCIRRSIVSHTYLHSFRLRICYHRWKKLPQHSFPIPIQYDN